jgi:peptidyl-prolyl cis-trans isomerase SurA
MKELEEGVLVAVLDAHWEKTLDCTESDLENYFKTHRTDYGGGTPHFKGAVIHCRNKKDAKKIKSYLKKLPESLWKEAVERMPEESSLHSKIEAGMFTIGMNPYVDKLVFKCGDYEALPDYPYTFVLGKKLKKGPTSYRDVMPRIKIDCLESMKKAEMEAIMKKYPIEINKEVLKTVNRAEN